jgi:hypothetical protein
MQKQIIYHDSSYIRKITLAQTEWKLRKKELKKDLTSCFSWRALWGPPTQDGRGRRSSGDESHASAPAADSA